MYGSRFAVALCSSVVLVACSADRFEGEWQNADRNIDSLVVKRVDRDRYKLTMNGDDYGFGTKRDGRVEFRLVAANASLRLDGDELICNYDNADQFRLRRKGK